MSQAPDSGPGPEASAERGRLRVDGQDSVDGSPVDVARWCEVALRVLEAEGVPQGRIDLHFVSAADIAALNEEHLGKQGPTDVVSFPYEHDVHAAAAAAGAGPDLVLGDVVVCAEVAEAQAPTHAGSLTDELALLVVHGVLHVLGWDHAEPEEAQAMQQREAEVLSLAGFEFQHPARR